MMTARRSNGMSKETLTRLEKMVEDSSKRH